MTDREIIRAMEICVSKREDDDCDKCPLCSPEEFIHCKFELAPVLNLINRQQAKIERLIEENEFLRRYISVHEEPHLSQIVANYNGILAATKAEAIKEFADKLKCDITVENTDDGYLDETIDYHFLMTIIDALVKEMVGDS